MKRLKKSIMLCLLACVLATVVGCGKVSTDSLQKLERADVSVDVSEKGETAEPLQEKNELPENGVISQAQLETIAGKEGVYEFYATDADTGIQYVWSYDGAKIRNAVEQRLKVRFVADGLDEVKKQANNATVGLGVTLEAMSPAAPPTLKLILPEKWDADAAVLCKMADGEPAQMAEVEIGSEQSGDEEVTALTFPVLETGDTYYIVGGRTTVEDTSGKDAGQADGKAGASGTSTGQKNQSTGKQNAGNPSKAVSDDKKGKTDKKETTDQGGKTGQTGNAAAPAETHTCMISIDCVTLAKNMDKLRKKEKAAFVPKDGWLLYASEVSFTPGDTVYDVLYDVCKKAGYQMEASYTPMYGSYYIEGINQLYEFDGGELSGWMYSVNGWYPNYGCSSYTVSDGDVIKWRYTLDLGKDIGGSNALG